MATNEEIEKAGYLIREDKIAKLKHPTLPLKDHYVVTGSKDDYLIILPNYCTCNHFQITCIKEKGRVCKHIMAARMAGDNIRELELNDWQNLVFRKR